MTRGPAFASSLPATCGRCFDSLSLGPSKQRASPIYLTSIYSNQLAFTGLTDQRFHVESSVALVSNDGGSNRTRTNVYVNPYRLKKNGGSGVSVVIAKGYVAARQGPTLRARWCESCLKAEVTSHVASKSNSTTRGKIEGRCYPTCKPLNVALFFLIAVDRYRQG